MSGSFPRCQRNCNICVDGALLQWRLTKVDILGKLKLKDLNSMKKCNVWLGHGMTWDEHMVTAAQDIGEQWLAE